MFDRWHYRIEELRLTDRWSAERQAEAYEDFRLRFATIGAQGWELVSYQAVPMTGNINTTSINGYAYMAIFKRRDPRPPAPNRPEVEGWHADPYKRTEQRFWNGVRWTSHVSNNGIQTEDETSESGTWE